jgi:hypothetical protein
VSFSIEALVLAPRTNQESGASKCTSGASGCQRT